MTIKLWTQDELTQLETMANVGLSTYQIAEALNRSVSAVQKKWMLIQHAKQGANEASVHLSRFGRMPPTARFEDLDRATLARMEKTLPASGKYVLRPFRYSYGVAEYGR